MNRVISSLDWQRLSDYLDKQLSPSDVIKLEEEIHQRQELQDALNELKATGFLLQSLPRRRVPRNFTLSARDLPAPKFHFPWLSGLSLATAISTLALIFTLFYRPLATASAPQTLSMAAQAAPMQAEAADTAAVASEVHEAQPAPIIIWGQPPIMATGKGGGIGGSGGGDGNAEMQVYAAPPESTAEAPALMAPAAPSPKEAENDVSPAESEPSASVESPPITDSGPILGIRPTAEQGQETNRYPEESGLNTASARSIQDENPSDDWFYIQLLLACLSVCLALLTFIYWLRQRR